MSDKGQSHLSHKFKSGHLDIVIATILINFFALTMPLVMMQVYDRILFNESLNTMRWLVVGAIVALFIESVEAVEKLISDTTRESLKILSRLRTSLNNQTSPIFGAIDRSHRRQNNRL